MDIRIRPLTRNHQAEVMDIFNYYIENSFAAYPEDTLPYEFFDRLLKMCEGYPAIVAENENGHIIGFGMLRAYHPLPTFSGTAEISYFIRPEFTGKGVGQIMLDHLIGKAKERRITSILANISSLNQGSINFHRRNGFVECGRFKGIVRKRGRVFDVVYMQKML